MTVYTVSSCDDLVREPLSRCVIGSYTTRGRALDKCVKYIMERLGMRQDLAWSTAHDENHPEAAEFFCKGRKDSVWKVRRGCISKFEKFLRDELGGQGCYYVCDGASNWHFDIDENGVEGELWHMVTWGDSDHEDPEFTTPFPETFKDRDAAVADAVKYAKDLMDSHHYGAKDREQTAYRLRHALEKDGQARLDLDDGTAVHWVLYHDDAKNVKE